MNLFGRSSWRRWTSRSEISADQGRGGFRVNKRGAADLVPDVGPPTPTDRSVYRPMTFALQTRNLTIRFGGHIAVDNVSCEFRPGELTAIVGPNGAGKTTYFNLISGQLTATAGEVLLDGRDITRLAAPARTRAGIGRAF